MSLSRTYLDITCVESGLESPPFSQMSSMEMNTKHTVKLKVYQQEKTLLNGKRTNNSIAKVKVHQQDTKLN